MVEPIDDQALDRRQNSWPVLLATAIPKQCIPKYSSFFNVQSMY